MDAIRTFEECAREFDKLPFSERIGFVKQVEMCYRRNRSGFVRLNGLVKRKEQFSVMCNEGEHYVYLWKHLDGEVFYIGSGVGQRYIAKRRNEDFLREIDKGDAVVYLVLAGVDKPTSLFYERYLSVCFTKAGIVLANKDNIPTERTDDTYQKWVTDNECRLSNELSKKVESAVLNKTLMDTEFSYEDFKAIAVFREECGEHYFSNLSEVS